MTTIAARQTPSGVQFAWDTRSTAANESWHREKVWDLGGTVVVGASGANRAGQVIQHHVGFSLSEVPDHGLESWLVKTFVPVVFGELKDRAGIDCLDGRMIVSVRGHAFNVTADGSVDSRPSGLYVAGSGGDYALGAMEAGATPLQAVQIAAKYDPATGGPFRAVFAPKWGGHTLTELIRTEYAQEEAA